LGSGGLEHLSFEAQARLAKLPVVLLENAGTTSRLDSTVKITTALPGVHCGGTVFRMDGVPLKLRALCDSSLSSASFVVSAIHQGVCSTCV
jgi:formylmethanofuran dehydrogenase subunit B